LDQAVSQRGFTVVDMRHDREIADMFQVGHGPDMRWNQALVNMARRPQAL
jgi:hypothetical protein